MNLFVNLALAALAVVVMYFLFTNVRFLHTLTLIAQTSPYEQAGEGAGRILVLGDSTGYGTGSTDPEQSIAGRLGADFPGYAIENRSVNGDTIADALVRARDVTGQYDLILLQLGGNDILQWRPVEQSVQDVQQLIELLSARADHLVMISAGDVGATTAFTGEQAEAYTEHTLAYHSALQALSERTEQFTYVSLYTPPADDPFIEQPGVYLARDGLHPSGAGYGVWYETLRPTVRQHLLPVE